VVRTGTWNLTGRKVAVGKNDKTANCGLGKAYLYDKLSGYDCQISIHFYKADFNTI
jgi:hypothetical protein